VSIRGTESSPDRGRAVNDGESSYNNQDEKKYIPPIHLVFRLELNGACAEQVTKSL
jgi:hypothetical protein